MLGEQDGAIVIFGAPGTLVTGNTIINDDRQGLGGINMVSSSQGGQLGVRPRRSESSLSLAFSPPVSIVRNQLN